MWASSAVPFFLINRILDSYIKGIRDDALHLSGSFSSSSAVVTFVDMPLRGNAFFRAQSGLTNVFPIRVFKTMLVVPFITS